MRRLVSRKRRLHSESLRKLLCFQHIQQKHIKFEEQPTDGESSSSSANATRDGDASIVCENNCPEKLVHNSDLQIVRQKTAISSPNAFRKGGFLSLKNTQKRRSR